MVFEHIGETLPRLRERRCRKRRHMLNLRGNTPVIFQPVRELSGSPWTSDESWRLETWAAQAREGGEPHVVGQGRGIPRLAADACEAFRWHFTGRKRWWGMFLEEGRRLVRAPVPLLLSQHSFCMLSLSYLYLTPPPLHINLEAFERLHFVGKCEDVNGIDSGTEGSNRGLDSLPL